jgi:hypothetical protein
VFSLPRSLRAKPDAAAPLVDAGGR